MTRPNLRLLVPSVSLELLRWARTARARRVAEEWPSEPLRPREVILARDWLAAESTDHAREAEALQCLATLAGEPLGVGLPEVWLSCVGQLAAGGVRVYPGGSWLMIQHLEWVALPRRDKRELPTPLRAIIRHLVQAGYSTPHSGLTGVGRVAIGLARLPLELLASACEQAAELCAATDLPALAALERVVRPANPPVHGPVAEIPESLWPLPGQLDGWVTL